MVSPGHSGIFAILWGRHFISTRIAKQVNNTSPPEILITAALCALSEKSLSSLRNIALTCFHKACRRVSSVPAALSTPQLWLRYLLYREGRLNKLVKARLQGTCGCQWNHKQGNHFTEPEGKGKETEPVSGFRSQAILSEWMRMPNMSHRAPSLNNEQETSLFLSAVCDREGPKELFVQDCGYSVHSFATHSE